MSGPELSIYEFEDFRLDAGKRLLTLRGELVPLTSKVFETLLHLVRHAGQLVAKDELIRAVWPDTVVEENNLNQNISAVRRLLGENRGKNRYIVTIPGQGYRFVATVRSPAAAPHETRRRKIGVLPFSPLTADHRDETLELGMADTLIARLSNIRATVVRPLSSVRKYTNLHQDTLAAGRELGVDSLLEGNIQRDGSNIRVTARLISVADGASLWAGTFDQEFTNVFALQDTIAEKVASALALRMGEDEKKRLTQRYTKDVEAYHLYLKGRYHLGKATKTGITKGTEFFQQAIDIDATYALAYAGLAEAYRRLPITSDVAPKEAFPKALAAASKALDIDENVVDARMALGFTRLWFDWDWAGSEKEFKLAIDLNPSSGEAHMGYAVLLTCVGRNEEAIVEGQRSVELDPLSLIVNANQAQFLHWARRDDEALARIGKTLEIDPTFWVANLAWGRIHIQRGEYQEAVTVLTKARDYSGANSETVSLIGYAHALAGNRARAEATLDELMVRSGSAYLPPHSVAVVHHGLRNQEETFRWLNKAYEARDIRLTFLKVDPKWDSIRSDARFVELLGRVGLE
jgi:DNA-binding winged helix-turn-helix (wHTH) protein/tetratricopeptide (TPR) repeat protein